MSSINAQAVSDMFDFVTESKSKIQAISREVLTQIGIRLVDYSAYGNPARWKRGRGPKGYTPGHFILNWQVGIDQLPRNEIPGTNASRTAAMGIAKERLSHLGRWTVGHKYYFTNNAPYASILETGLHSFQVIPPGMVGKVQLEYEQIVKDAIAKIL